MITENYFCVRDKKRSSHRRCSERKLVLRNSAKFTEKHRCQSFFLIKLQEFGRSTKNTFFTEHLREIASAKISDNTTNILNCYFSN